MKVGIIGLPQTGKKTLFQILTGKEITEPSKASKPLPGAADIIDSRFNQLVEMYEPKKNVRARIDIVLLPKMEAETISKGEIFRDIADMDAICHVVRSFEDDAIYHAQGSVDAVRDFEMVNSELIMHDQIFVEKRIERLEAMVKKIKDEDQQKELVLMGRLKTFLEEEKPLRLIELTEDEEKLIRSYPFITRKKLVIGVNVSEDDLGNESLLADFQKKCEHLDIEVMLVSAKVEAEIAMLDTQEEKDEFLQDMGIKQTALETLTKLCLKSLDLISFFTVGKDEVRQWLVRKGSSAPRAAGVIHSDLERGFIRAEVFKYEELMAQGSEAELKKAGKIYVEGKDYIVSDGDILNIRFSV
ncbi:MAG: redox-regulated ATPase YchF [Proteobacteria bacterium]|nr:redox-regulated ATPase YchF [Pseudomonadota bacterium]MBU1388063.1 redox-regulated ATPase YchF [Pseudomonadota bacterium]MBU1542126.1 redox-regulated ATPase YchF [Pseudomonadota bacterium]MBU2482390.1 redox-regulated ATPase YchF [Pseudomonadota bacterium]